MTVKLLVGFSYLVVLLLGFAAGWFERDIRERLRKVTQLAITLANKKSPEPEATGKVVEPTDDPVAAARREFEERSARLNS